MESNAQFQRQQAQQQEMQQEVHEASCCHEQQCTCTVCNSQNEPDDRFCAECGSALQQLQQAVCHQCGAPCKPEGDICEACGAWLLVGQCMFCYASVSEDDLYCGECGNAKDGVVCPECGNVSNYDFCRKCSTPITDAARQVLLETQQNPALQEITAMLSALAEYAAQADPVSTTSENETGLSQGSSKQQKEELAALRAYREKLAAKERLSSPSTMLTSLFTRQQKESIHNLDADIEREVVRKEELRKAEEEERRRKAAEEARFLQQQLSDALKKIADIEFKNQQEARRCFDAIKAALPKDSARKFSNHPFELVWNCYAYNNEHPSPAHCTAPGKGGYWFFKPGPVKWELGWE